MSDLYVHQHQSLTREQTQNLLTLARYLVGHSSAIAAGGGLAFGDPAMRDMAQLPAETVTSAQMPLPPLGHGPRAGVAPLADEDWPTYAARAFGIIEDGPFIAWLQSPDWQATEPSPVGAALRIAYVLDYGVPFDHDAIARGEAGTDYDENGFLWDRLGMLPPGYTGGPLKPLRQWPARPPAR